jgi:hypothetical protein
MFEVIEEDLTEVEEAALRKKNKNKNKTIDEQNAMDFEEVNGDEENHDENNNSKSSKRKLDTKVT